MDKLFETRALKLIGVDIATPEQVAGITRGWTQACQQAGVPYPVQATARPVFADADGKHFVLEAASNGLFGRPWETSPKWDTKDPNVRGGLLTGDDLPHQSPGPGAAASNEFSAVYAAAGEAIANKGGPGLGAKVLEQPSRWEPGWPQAWRGRR